MRGEIQAEPALDAEIAIIGRAVEGRFHAIDLLVLDLQIHLAADAAIGAGGADGGIGGHRGHKRLLDSSIDAWSADWQE